nr:Hsp20/alpha crystallin family protein [uncultured Desulfobacter sp.]
MNIKKFAPWNWFKQKDNKNEIIRNDYNISMGIPGVSDKEIRLEVIGNAIVIRGEKKQTHEDKHENFYRIERSYASFQRTLPLPMDADQSGIDAKFKNGILKISIPRSKPPKRHPNQIEIKYA